MCRPKKEADLSKPSPRPHVSLADRIPTILRKHFVAMTGEFVGTFLFLFFAFAGTTTANTPPSTTGNTTTTISQGPQPTVLLFISLSFADSLASTVWSFYRISGGQFNPAVTIAIFLVDAISPIRCILLIPAQLAGTIASAWVVEVLFPGPLAVTTALSGNTTVVQGVFIEMFLTAQLVSTILMLAVEKHRATFLAPIGD